MYVLLKICSMYVCIIKKENILIDFLIQVFLFNLHSNVIIYDIDQMRIMEINILFIILIPISNIGIYNFKIISNN